MKRIFGRSLVSCSLVALALAVVTPPAEAVNDNARIAVTVKAHATKAQCTVNAPQEACSGFTTEGDLDVTYDLYVFVANADPGPGIAGAAFGIRYDNTPDTGLDIFQWTKCSDLEFPGQGWPASGGGNTLTFVGLTNCQRTERGTEGVHAVLGWFYCIAYSVDFFAIVARNIAIPDIKVADCSAQETNLTGLVRAGRVAFSAGAAVQGCNPCIAADGSCLVSPVDETTWGGIKKGYRGR